MISVMGVLSKPFRRRLLFGLLVAASTAVACAVQAMILSNGGIVVLEGPLMALFAVLFLWISASFWTAFLGFCVCLRRRVEIMPPAEAAPSDGRAVSVSRTAIIMPVYNEDVAMVFGAVRAMFESLRRQAPDLDIDFYVLSDSTDPDTWVAEELAWGALCRDIGAAGRLFYRHRARNTHQKYGNIADFCRHAGHDYDYMMVLDADSLMSGGTIQELVRRMDANPDVGLIQTPPLPLGGRSLFARLQQFAATIYGPVFAAGTAYWHLGESNYWGHNAILRVSAYIDHCGLPDLPGRRPLGGQILSHDFVEAALLRRAGWRVWLAADLGDSFEAPPETIAEYAKRDRRWCQGNLQHLRILFAHGLHPMSRLHLAMGGMAYLSSSLWLLLLVGSALEVLRHTFAKHEYFIGNSLFPSWPVSYVQETMILLAATLALLYLPKLLGLIVLARDPQGMAACGGAGRVATSALIESVLSALVAPVLMSFHILFVVQALCGRDAGWMPQNRDGGRLRLRDLVALHGGHTLVAAIIGVAVYVYLPIFFWWLTPVLLGPVISIPLDMLLSSRAAGCWARRRNLFLVPSETRPSSLIRSFRRSRRPTGKWSAEAGASVGRPITRVVHDPIANALHLLFLKPRAHPRSERLRLDSLVLKAHEQGIEALPAAEQKELLSDRDSMVELHALAWDRKINGERQAAVA